LAEFVTKNCVVNHRCKCSYWDDTLVSININEKIHV